MEFLIAQILGILGSILIIFSTQMKDKKKYLLLAAISYVFFIINMFLLKAYSGAINSLILLILTIILANYKKEKIPVWLVIIFFIILLLGNFIIYENVFSLLPAIASNIYLIILLSKDMKEVRKLNVFVRVLWLIYDFIIHAYTTFVFDIISFVSSIIAVYRYDIKKLNSENEKKQCQ